MQTNAGDISTPGPAAKQSRSGVWLTDASLFLMAAIWGVNFVVVKYATTLVSPLPFNALRVSLAAVTLLLIASLGKSPWPTRRQALALMGLGVLGNGLYQMFFISGVALTRAGDAALLIAATPAFIALIGRFRGVERIGSKGWAGILMSIAGISLISGAAVIAHTQGSLFGDLLILCGSLCWAIYTVMLKPYLEHVNGIKVAALTMAGGALALMTFGWRAVVSTPWRDAPSNTWWAMAYSGLAGLVLAYMFWYRGVRIIGPTRTAMYSNLQPIVAVAVAWVVLGELPTVWQGVGAASIMSGLLLTRS